MHGDVLAAHAAARAALFESRGGVEGDGFRGDAWRRRPRSEPFDARTRIAGFFEQLLLRGFGRIVVAVFVADEAGRKVDDAGVDGTAELFDEKDAVSSVTARMTTADFPFVRSTNCQLSRSRTSRCFPSKTFFASSLIALW
jgi:hypothetical protein